MKKTAGVRLIFFTACYSFLLNYLSYKITKFNPKILTITERNKKPQ